MIIVGLAGAMGAGKDTAFGFLQEWGNENKLVVQRFSFADKLKISAMRALGHPADLGNEHAVHFADALKQPGSTIQVNIPDEALLASGGQIIDEAAPNTTTFSGRQYLQWYGTEAHRDVFGTDFWVDQLEAQLDAADLEGFIDVAVITDVRFPNEGELLSRIGEIWEIKRPDAGGEHLQHASEAGLPEGQVQLVLRNEGSLDDLRALVRKAADGKLR